jgi:DNA-binding GntR family transcriptional regulator
MNKEPLPSRFERPLAADVVDRLRNEIISGQLAPGEPLAELAIAARFGLSRVPVREALIELEREGLIQFESTGRTRVRTLLWKDLLEIIEARVILETAAVRKLTLEWTQQDTLWLEENIAAQVKTATLEELTHLDLEMHQYLMRRTGNERLLRLWQSIRWQFQMCLARTHRLQEKLADEPHQISIGGHRRLLASLQSGDPEFAASTVKAHIELAFNWEVRELESGSRTVQPEPKPRVNTRRQRTATLLIHSPLCNAEPPSLARASAPEKFQPV